ncbi:MAG: hypothetical protein KAV82_12750 [Phycisphaerae bacterium]|nr:hypothetical protein [Phycisphaerae bacterium]
MAVAVALHWMVVSSAAGGTGNYLIITAEDYTGSAPLAQFADAKAAMGFDVTIHSVPAGTYGKTIKAYIENLWGTPDAPDYILLVGDTGGSCSTSALIPHWSGGGPKNAVTDLPYACMDGPDDWYPDIAIGRFSITSVSMLQGVPDKGAAAILFPGTRIYYEEYPWDECISLEKFFFESFFAHDIWEVGPAWQAATYRLLAQDGPTDVVRDYFEMYNLLGDPALLLPAGVGFSLSADPVLQNLCSPLTDEAVYTIEVKQHVGFDQPVTLTTLGEPPGATVDFSTNSVPPPFTSVLTISNIAGSAPGEYSIEISGAATGVQRSTVMELNLSNGVPGDVTLISPPDDAPDVPRKPTLTWEPVSLAVECELQVATEPDFTNVAYNATVTGTSHTPAGNLNLAMPYYWRVRASNGCGAGDYSTAFTFTTLEPADYSTEQFTGDFDLDNLTLAFIPDASGEHYDICRHVASELPTDPAGGTVLSILEDSAAWVNLADDKTVLLYNISYSNFAICDNGGVTFGGSNMGYAESLSIHFNQPRISALFNDLSASAGGSVSWKQLDDRVVFTYDNVPEWNTSNSNTFQIEMFFDGEIRITWLDVDSNDSIVGLSAGNGLPDDFVETDVSTSEPCPCGDYDADGDVDLHDFAAFQVCFGQAAAGECQPGNVAGGDTIDFDDFALFADALNGPQ